MSHGLNCAILFADSRKKGSFLTGQSTIVSPSYVSLQSMFFINYGISLLPMRRFDTYLPYVPSQKEVWDFIQSFSNLKHKAVLSLMYSSGLRIREVCALRYEDISRSSMRIHICHSKARSDRYAILSQKALDILTQYWFRAGKPRDLLFPNRNDPQRPMATYTVNQFIFAKRNRTRPGTPVYLPYF